MRHRTELPHRVREVRDVRAKMSDGCVLAGRLWLPEGEEREPAPAIFEFLPYRKGDATAERDALNGGWLAGHGFAFVRFDMRGTGDSEGLMRDEYLPREQRDGVEIVEWIAAQPWCTGRVAMMGLSWGAFSGLQVAAQRPPALGAVVAVAGTDDRYADDIHYIGGALLNDNLAWAGVMLGYLARPPDPAIVGERWRAMWHERLEAVPLLAADWLTHQRRDEYWKNGSVGEHIERVQVPVLAAAGWADAYSNAVPRMVAILPGPAMGLVGPWVHRYPHLAVPEPTVGFLQLVRRFCDVWLRDEGAGLEDLPRYVAYLDESDRPRNEFEPHPGRWVAEDRWPSPRIVERVWFLGDGTLERERPASRRLAVRSKQTVGLSGGRFMPTGLGPDAPGDQRDDDAASVTFDAPVLRDRVEILGAPVVELELSSDRPQANVCVRLCDVGPEGDSVRVTWGMLNLSHRSGHEQPEPLVPGQVERVSVRLNDAAHAFLPGRRIRVALSTSYWPMVWPAPEPVGLTVWTGASRLLLPVRPPAEAGPEPAPPAFEPAEAGPPLEVERLRPVATRREQDTLPDGSLLVCIEDDLGLRRLRADGLELGATCVERYAIHPDDPLSARASSEWVHFRARGPWRVRVRSRVEMSCDAGAFHLRARLEAFEGEERVHERKWSRRVRREHL